MTNQIALWLGLILVAAIAADVVVAGTDHLIFLGRQFLALTEWLAFWR